MLNESPQDSGCLKPTARRVMGRMRRAGAAQISPGACATARSNPKSPTTLPGGIPGTQMPAFPMSPENVRALVAYLRSLSESGPDLAITGNAANGQQVFFGAGHCSNCHMYQGHGGRLGPDLSRIGEARTARQLQLAITQPHKEQIRGFESVEVRLRDGGQIRGVLKNQDTFSVQVMDQGEKLHMLAKKDAASVRLTGKSLMPENAVTGAPLDDVIAFLKDAPAVNAVSTGGERRGRYFRAPKGGRQGAAKLAHVLGRLERHAL